MGNIDINQVKQQLLQILEQDIEKAIIITKLGVIIIFPAVLKKKPD